MRLAGAVNGVTLVYPREFYAMADAGLLFAPLSRVHPRFVTPHVAVASYAVIALAGVGLTVLGVPVYLLRRRAARRRSRYTGADRRRSPPDRRAPPG